MTFRVPPVQPKPSPHRRRLLQLSKSLEQQDINELLYLSEDFIPQMEAMGIKCGVDLMRSLEKHGRLGPGQYEYLVSCLIEIGRIDLAQKLEPATSSFGMEGQLHLPPAIHWKHKSIQDKKMQFLKGKGELHQLLRNPTFWEAWVNDTLGQLSTQLEYTDTEWQQSTPRAHNTNQTLKAAGKLIFGTLQQSGFFIAELEQHHEGLPLSANMQLLERLEEDLSTALGISPLRCAAPSTQIESIQRFKDKHPLSVVATKLFASLSDLLKELYGETEAKKQLKDLEESVGAFKSLLHTNAHLCFGFLSLVHLTDTVASSGAQVLDQEAKEIIASLVQGFPTGAILTVSKLTLAALEGTSVLKALREDKEMEVLFSADPPTIPCPCKANKSLRFGLLTVLLTLYKSANLTRCEWKSIQSQIMQQFRMNLSEPTYNPFLEIDTIVMNSLDRLFKHFSSSTLPTLSDMSDQLKHFSFSLP